MKHHSHGRSLEPFKWDDNDAWYRGPVTHPTPFVYSVGWEEWEKATMQMNAQVSAPHIVEECLPPFTAERAWESTVPLDLHSNFMPTVPQPL